jgi:heme/copper-type cytochrome/quinol oxidase subunit 2
MTIGGALALIAAGAILKWAVTAHVSWIDLQTTGTVLFVIGLAGLVVALLYTFWWSQRERDRRDERTRVMRGGPPPPPRA